MNYQNILLCLAIGFPLSSMCMDRQPFKRSFESSDQGEIGAYQDDASDKKSRSEDRSYDVFIEQISQQMEEVNLGTAQDTCFEDAQDVCLEDNDNTIKRSREDVVRSRNDIFKKNKSHEAAEEHHLFDRLSIHKNVKREIFAQLKSINNEIESNQNINHANLIDRYLSLVKHLLETYEQFMPGYARKYGYTPLHIAAAHGHLPIVKFLIEQRGIDPATTTNHGRTALSLAENNKHQRCADYLFSVVYDWM